MCSIYPVDFQQTNEQEDRERMRWWRYDNREGDVVCLTKREHKRAISSLSHGPSCRYIQLLASIHFSQIQSSFVGKLQTNAERTGTGTQMFASNLEWKESLTVVLVVHFFLSHQATFSQLQFNRPAAGFQRPDIFGCAYTLRQDKCQLATI